MTARMNGGVMLDESSGQSINVIERRGVAEHERTSMGEGGTWGLREGERQTEN